MAKQSILSPRSWAYKYQRPTGVAWTSTVLLYPSTKMYVAGIMDHFSDAPRMELIVWASVVGIGIPAAFRTYGQCKNSKAGDIKPGSTGPRFWTNLALLGQFSGLVAPSFIYWTTTAYNKFQQPGWMIEHALPSPPDAFGVDGVIVGRAVGLLVHFAGTTLVRAALKALGDQYHAIGVSGPVFSWITDANQRLTFVPGDR